VKLNEAGSKLSTGGTRTGSSESWCGRQVAGNSEAQGHKTNQV
jgi:hypothetical protein